MHDLLFLAHRIPYPPNKGDKIRSWNVLRHLAENHRVHLGFFVDDPEDWVHVDRLRGLCASVMAVPLDPRRGRLRALTGLLRGEPLTVPYFRSRRLHAWVDNRIAAGARLGFAYSSSMAPYLMPWRERLERLVVDLVDVDSDKWRQYADESRNPAARLVYGREARLLLELERRIAREADATLLVSEDEAELFRTLAPESRHRIVPMRNGVDAAYFSPERDYPDPFPAGARVAVFTGAMDYRPNIDAVAWFAAEILPRLRRRDGDWRFCIVGSNPAEEVRKLAADDAVTVTGRVADVRPYLAHAAACVAPLRVARGIQNKVLEAMAMARPTVVTPAALEGIEAEPGRHLLLAAEPEDFAAAVAQAAHPDSLRLGAAARARVLDAYAWPAALASVDQLLAPAVLEAASGPTATARLAT